MLKSVCDLYPKSSCAGGVVPVWWCGTLKLGLGGRIDSIILGRHHCWSCGRVSSLDSGLLESKAAPRLGPWLFLLLPLCYLWGSQGDLLQRPRDAITQSLGCSASKTEFNKPLSFIKHPASGILLQKTTKECRTWLLESMSDWVIITVVVY